MTDGSVGKVSGDPLFMLESSDEVPVECPREESDMSSVSGRILEPEARFAIGCAISAAGMSDGGKLVDSAEDETAVKEIPPVRAVEEGENVRER